MGVSADVQEHGQRIHGESSTDGNRKKLQVFPLEWCEAYAEKMLGADVVSLQSMTRHWLGEVFLNKLGEVSEDGKWLKVPSRELGDAVAEQIGREIDGRFRRDMIRARKRVANVLRELLGFNGEVREGYVWLSIDELRNRRLVGERQNHAVNGGLRLARERINWEFRWRQSSTIKALSTTHRLSEEEARALEHLFGHFYYDGGPCSGVVYESLRCKLPEGYVHERGAGLVLGQELIDKVGTYIRSNDVETAFEIPEAETDRVPILRLLDGVTTVGGVADQDEDSGEDDAADEESVALKEGDSVKIFHPDEGVPLNTNTVEVIRAGAKRFGLNVETVTNRRGQVEIVFLIDNGDTNGDGLTSWLGEIMQANGLSYEVETE